ncbi:MAG TPA: hypothetical protein IAC41_08095 [Candidatus Merdenecus merdavium]|nr:hypothetical protein [Candidatus Merdenecus merdavium]
MVETKDVKGFVFAASSWTCVLSIIAFIFFALSYQTGYVSIVYGEKNSIVITIEAILILMLTSITTIFQITGKVDKREFYDVAMYVLVPLLTTATLLLLVDRVDAIGNCIVAPWDAGHGGEESCYLSFVAMGCWFVADIINIIGCFIGYKEKRSQ